MKLSILAFLFLATLVPAFAAAVDGGVPAGVDCTYVASVPKTFGGTQWNAIGCKDGITLLLVAAQDNPAFPSYLTVYQKDGVYHVSGEGTGAKSASDAAYAQIAQLSTADIQAVIKQSLAASVPAAPGKTCAEMLPVTAANMVGTWLSVDDEPKQITIQYNADGSFSGKITEDSKVLWLYAGTWKLEGSKYTEIYTFSSLERIPAGTTDSDEIAGIGCGVIVYSEPSGLLKRYRRIKD